MVPPPAKYPPISIAMKPRFMTIPEWRELVAAAHSGWLAYLLKWPVPWLFILMFAFDVYLWWAKRAGWNLPLGFREGPSERALVWVIGPIFAFCVLLRFIDWTGKHRVARRIGLLDK